MYSNNYLNFNKRLFIITWRISDRILYSYQILTQLVCIGNGKRVLFCNKVVERKCATQTAAFTVAYKKGIILHTPRKNLEDYALRRFQNKGYS